MGLEYYRQVSITEYMQLYQGFFHFVIILEEVLQYFYVKGYYLITLYSGCQVKHKWNLSLKGFITMQVLLVKCLLLLGFVYVFYWFTRNVLLYFFCICHEWKKKLLFIVWSLTKMHLRSHLWEYFPYMTLMVNSGYQVLVRVNKKPVASFRIDLPVKLSCWLNVNFCVYVYVYKWFSYPCLSDNQVPCWRSSCLCCF